METNKIRSFYDNFLPELNRADAERVHFLLTRTANIVSKDFQHVNFIRVMDIGCGTGEITCLISMSFPKLFIIGSDVSSGRISRAKKLSKERGIAERTEFLVAAAEHLPYVSDAAVIVITTEVLEHLRPLQRKELLREVARILKYKGRLLLTTPNALHLGLLPKVMKAKILNADSVSEQIYDRPVSPIQLNFLLTSAGFRIDARYGGTLPVIGKQSGVSPLNRLLGIMGLYQFVESSTVSRTNSSSNQAS